MVKQPQQQQCAQCHLKTPGLTGSADAKYKAIDLPQQAIASSTSTAVTNFIFISYPLRERLLSPDISNTNQVERNFALTKAFL